MLRRERCTPYTRQNWEEGVHTYHVVCAGRSARELYTQAAPRWCPIPQMQRLLKLREAEQLPASLRLQNSVQADLTTSALLHYSEQQVPPTW